jgi:uncharacterized membrane-anchored protein YjiN (DUF445 family)
MSESVHELQRMRRIAGGALLAVFAGMVVFRLLEGSHPAFGYLRAFCEAATVGALADWFAVVALFRHPFGIPTPHTAILPNNKDRVADSLAEFVVSSFLTKEQLGPRIKELNYAEYLSRWLRENIDFLVSRATDYAPQIIAGISDEEIARLLAERSRKLVGSVSLGPLLGGGLNALAHTGRSRQIFLSVLESTEDLILSNRDLIEANIREEIPLPIDFLRNLPGLNRLEPVLDQLKDALASVVAKRTIEKVQNVLSEAQRDPDHPLQTAFAQKLTALIEDLKSSPQMASRIREYQDTMVAGPAIDDFSLQAWREVKTFLLQDCASEDSTMRVKLREAVKILATHLAENEKTQKDINDFIGAHVLASILSARPMVRDLVVTIIQGWDGDKIIQRLETTVGRDLQFIRLNGTIIGGLVGLLIHSGFALAGY